MKIHYPKVTLASSSIYRRDLLAKLLKSFDQASPEIDESQINNEDPVDYVKRLALEKAYAVADMGYRGLIIASDQCASINTIMGDNKNMEGAILGKPSNFDRAFAQLTASSGNRVDFFTSVAVLDTHSDRIDVQHDRVKVQFRDLTAEEIKVYLQREKPFDCAGSFKCEGLGISLFESIESTDPNSLIGLPLIKLNSMLIDFGLNPLLIDT